MTTEQMIFKSSHEREGLMTDCFVHVTDTHSRRSSDWLNAMGKDNKARRSDVLVQTNKIEGSFFLTGFQLT